MNSFRVDQAALFEAIMSGKYEYDEEYWSDISDAGECIGIIHTSKSPH